MATKTLTKIGKQRLLARWIETLVMDGIDISQFMGLSVNSFDYDVIREQIREFDQREGIEI